jgi:hypothetical protein
LCDQPLGDFEGGDYVSTSAQRHARCVPRTSATLGKWIE